MSDQLTLRIAFAVLTLGALAGCGQKGPLYLPDAASEVVTRPVATPPTSPSPDENTSVPNSPQTVDDPVQAPAAPEVTAPVGTPEADPKKEKSATPPPPK
jgi:predicted small lipoprotein YifL